MFMLIGYMIRLIILNPIKWVIMSIGFFEFPNIKQDFCWHNWETKELGWGCSESKCLRCNKSI